MVHSLHHLCGIQRSAVQAALPEDQDSNRRRVVERAAADVPELRPRRTVAGLSGYWIGQKCTYVGHTMDCGCNDVLSLGQPVVIVSDDDVEYKPCLDRVWVSFVPPGSTSSSTSTKLPPKPPKLEALVLIKNLQPEHGTPLGIPPNGGANGLRVGDRVTVANAGTGRNVGDEGIVSGPTSTGTSAWVKMSGALGSASQACPNVELRCSDLRANTTTDGRRRLPSRGGSQATVTVQRRCGALTDGAQNPPPSLLVLPLCHCFLPPVRSHMPARSPTPTPTHLLVLLLPLLSLLCFHHSWFYTNWFSHFHSSSTTRAAVRRFVLLLPLLLQPPRPLLLLLPHPLLLPSPPPALTARPSTVDGAGVGLFNGGTLPVGPGMIVATMGRPVVVLQTEVATDGGVVLKDAAGRPGERYHHDMMVYSAGNTVIVDGGVRAGVRHPTEPDGVSVVTYLDWYMIDHAPAPDDNCIAVVGADGVTCQFVVKPNCWVQSGEAFTQKYHVPDGYIFEAPIQEQLPSFLAPVSSHTLDAHP